MRIEDNAENVFVFFLENATLCQAEVISSMIPVDKLHMKIYRNNE